MLKKEKNSLLVLPPRYDTVRITEARVDYYSTVSVDTNHYLVPDHLVGEFVLAKIYSDKVRVIITRQRLLHIKDVSARSAVH